LGKIESGPLKRVFQSKTAATNTSEAHRPFLTQMENSRPCQSHFI